MVVQTTDCRSQGCRDWVRAGRPRQLARPAEQFANTVRGHGFTVYMHPDDSHLTASTPQDHTYFSATGWPVAAPRWVCNACDIMPTKAGGMAELTRMARQIIADKDAGVPGTEWIKYINWTDENGQTWQTSWKGAKRTTTNNDKGHTHISGRSDYTTQELAPYDPVARMNGGGVAAGGGDEMAGFARGQNGQLYYVNGMQSRPIADSDIAHIIHTSQQGFSPTLAKRPANPAAGEWESEWVRLGWGPNWAGTVLQLDVTALAAALGKALDVEIGEEVITAALESARGQAALTQAADAAEDS